jgi:uncharacterized membrane protein YhaH (DUF805 family)
LFATTAGRLATRGFFQHQSSRLSSTVTGYRERVHDSRVDHRGGIVSPRVAAPSAIALTAGSWLLLVFAGFGGERASCPDPTSAWVDVLAVACALAASLGMALAIWSYRASDREPSGEWLLGAAGLYIATLGWAATITSAITLLTVDLCSF